jgi:ribosomal protein S8
VDDYYNWLREKTFIQKDSNTDWFLINTPFVGAFNDTIEIYAQKKGNHLRLSDNGETMSNLELQGLHIQGSKRRRAILDTILLNYGVRAESDELTIEANIENFSQSKHNFLSAIASIFKEDVRTYLDSHDIIYTPDFISKGATGLEFNFDFQIAKKNKEIVIKSFNTVNKSNLSTFLFSWDDIKPVREKITKKDVNAIAIINNIDKEVRTEFLDALKAKNADYILWSERESEKSKELISA